MVFALQMVVVLNYNQGAPDLSFPLQMIVGETKCLPIDENCLLVQISIRWLMRDLGFLCK